MLQRNFFSAASARASAGHPMFRSSVLAAGALLVAMSSHAASDTLAANTARICNGVQQVDVEKAATTLLKKYPVDLMTLDTGDAAIPMTSRRVLMLWLLQHAPENPGVRMMHAELTHMLQGQVAQFQPSAPTTAENFLANDPGSAPVACTNAPFVATGAPAAAVAAATTDTTSARNPADRTWKERLRINGNPDQLNIERTDKAFATMDRAALNMTNNDIAKSTSRNIVIFAGYSLFKSAPNDKLNTFEVVPYAGVRQNTVTNTNTNARTSDTKTINAGVLSSFNFGRLDTRDADNFAIRPDYLYDSVDSSRLASLNFQYVPIREARLNDGIKLPINATLKPILIFQSRNGHYLGRGNGNTNVSKQDFFRLGAHNGLFGYHNEEERSEPR